MPSTSGRNIIMTNVHGLRDGLDGDDAIFDQNLSIPAALYGPAMPHLLRDELLAEIFAASASAFKDSICIVSGEQRLTYAQVDAKANALARGLRRHAIGPGCVVGLWMARGPELLISQIAIAKTGAAWLPFDSDVPVERVSECLVDCQAKALLVGPDHFARASGHANSEHASFSEHASCPVLMAETLVDPDDATDIDARALGCTPDHPAYMIYTSGSTGKPKGIVITGRNICHYLRAANEVYGLVSSDVVFQGASVAFDLSMEEIWVPYLVGASLFVATPAIMGDADALPDVMDAAGVTVLDTVPTLLSMLSRDVPGLRIIILGGEACPPSLGARWCAPHRKIFNSYGPTEATVVATISEVRVGEAVTIGKPIPNYTCYVVNEDMTLAVPGKEGELLIGGPGMAMGYLGREDLTAEKFIPNPFGQNGGDPILYRSGDAVALDDKGDILFRGRIDDQVKIRGFRVELGEIEARLSNLEGIGQVAVVLRTDDGLDQLVAFVVPGAGSSELEPKALRTQLRETLPAYMVPARFEALTELPRLPSGKVNRNELKKRQLSVQEALEAQEDPRTETEAKLLEAAKAVLPPQAIAFDADFFTDLGGHSLLAARFVSILRQTPAFATVTLQELYSTRTLRNLGNVLDGRAAQMGERANLDLSFTPPPLMRRFLCGSAQAAALVLIFSFVTIQWLGLFLASIWIVSSDASIWVEMATLMGVYVVTNIGMKGLVVALKWAVIGRTKPGVYPLWGVYYFRVWFVQRLVQVTALKFLQCSPLMRWYMRALGAKIGKDSMIGEFEAGAIDLLTIGDNVSTGLKTKFANTQVIGDKMHIGPISIGDGAYTGNCSVFGPNVHIGRDAQIGDLTALLSGTIVPDAEIWDGSPARKTGMVDVAALPPVAQASALRRSVHGVIYVLSYIVILMLGLLPIFPAFYVLYNLDNWIDSKGVVDYEIPWSMLPMLTWPTAFALVVVAMVVIVAVRWMILPRVSTGVYSIHSNFYLRKWIVGLATEVTLETLSSLYATLYMRHWYRAMGAKIGKGSEISTNLAGRYDLVDIGADNFIGDEAVFGDEELHRGWMVLEKVRTGDRVFFGNDCVISAGAVIEDDALIGVKSKLPEGKRVGQKETWFGSPAMSIPNRQKVAISANFTYQPPMWFKAFRYVFEALHTSLPTALFISMAYITADVIAMPLETGDWGLAIAYFLAAGIAMAIVAIVFCASIKWVLMGVYKPVMKPMWSFWAMRTEAIAVLYGGLVGKASSEFLRGTPFLPWALRLYGCRIGKGVWMELTDVTEFDCVTVGDYCSLNMMSCLQTHLYEDRIMKVGRVHLGCGVTVGPGATVLYDSVVGDWAQLGPLTVVMKAEAIPGNTQWVGAPAEPFVPALAADKQEGRAAA
jgi:non-ribosomal peptide synthetase-like protein